VFDDHILGNRGRNLCAFTFHHKTAYFVVRLSRLFYKTTCYIFILRNNPVLTHSLTLNGGSSSSISTVQGVVALTKARGIAHYILKTPQRIKVGMKERCLNLHIVVLKHTRNKGGTSHLESDGKRRRRCPHSQKYSYSIRLRRPC